MKHIFVINPIAGKGKHVQRLQAQIQAITAARQLDYAIYFTTGPMDATRYVQTQAAAAAEPLRFYACGGDGTLNEVASGAYGYPLASVSHYPCGTGNDFVKMFGPEQGRFLSLEDLIDGELVAFDLIDVCGRKSINISSVGIDARIGTAVHKYSDLPLVGGKTGYIVSLAAELAKGVASPFTVRWGEQEITTDFSLICLCNGRFYGGSFNPMPVAMPNDGYLDCLLVRGVSRLTFLRLVGKYAAGRYRELGERALHLRTRQLEISAQTPFAVNIDGELFFTDRAPFQLLPGALPFACPKNLAFWQNIPEVEEENGSLQSFLLETQS